MIMKIKELILKYKEIIVYVAMGMLTTVVNLAVFTVVGKILGADKYLITNVIAWFAAVSFSYITTKMLVFESKSWSVRVLLREILSFLAARVVTLGIEEAGLYFFVDILSFKELSIRFFSFEIGGELIAKGLIAVVVVVINYVLSKLVIFKKQK